MEQTSSERIAQDLGYPLGVCGYSPNERYYWFDPALGWANTLLNPQHYGLDPEACAKEIASLYALPLVWNENMAPRFITGTFLAGKVLAVGEVVQVGNVLMWWEPGDARDCPTLGRVVAVEPDLIRLACDNGGHAYRLAWGPGAPAWEVYRVTHYLSQPYPHD
ncbi:hypothetical protein [Hymenobacter cheonanensis]|uniref:hypothetical protein n=1 Tax=Hymenobacter sp. CA2-7 TaxID=3063993 RepID=UPI002713C8AD|nr:hypothetical protein [Hymenobacter sp. CA2-7]MDO7888187.1 hypothetical protein [Hymenobacter sp. CA2-7]